MGSKAGRARAILLAAALPLALGACAGEGGLLPRIGALGSGGADQPGAAAGPGTRDVEAPEAFSLTAEGLWDGRPSLGGIWVAHPDAAQPERVRITDPESGESVIGALFKRERELPGPALQVSSEAAGALGMLAGQPRRLDVVALRREAAPKPAEGTGALPAAAPITATPLGAAPPA